MGDVVVPLEIKYIIEWEIKVGIRRIDTKLKTRGEVQKPVKSYKSCMCIIEIMCDVFGTMNKEGEMHMQ